ncbi:MAG TPA: choice-of-anchor V domain-containing protein [Longimicrobium sp.]|nr:choice-of-anchor V domain-containing protein [Longimicrobium sp.]
MKTRGARIFAAGLLSAAATALLAAAGPTRGHGAYPDKPPLAHTGGFGEPTCLQCHVGGEPNAAGGTLAITGVPASYRPGETYRLTVRMTRPEMVTGGFQLSSRFAEGAAAGRQAGALRAVDGRAQVAVDSTSGVQYASHTKPGTEQTAHWATEWALDWTAPAEGSVAVIFHLAANSTNGDESPIGDFVYWTQVTSRGP